MDAANVRHEVVEQVIMRANRAREDSDFTYFFSMLLAGEALAKTIVLGLVAAIIDDKDRNRYRLEHQLVRADGIGEWSRVLEDAVTGPSSQFLLAEAREEQTELTRGCKQGDWQYEAVREIKAALDVLGIEAEDLTVKSDLKRWFRLFATLRNKTRGHGATKSDVAGSASVHLERSILLIYRNFRLFRRQWAHLHRNISGKYRVSAMTPSSEDFAEAKKSTGLQIPDGVYVSFGSMRSVRLMQSDPELQDFFFANGGLGGKKFEMLSYYSDDKMAGDGTAYLVPPGQLPPSETEGPGELAVKGNCFSNAPELPRDYVPRVALEQDLLVLLEDQKRPMVTLLGRGGIGKTSLALKVLESIYAQQRYTSVVWFSARDVDLQLSGPKSVRPRVLTPEDMAQLYASLVLPASKIAEKGFNSRAFLEQQLQAADLGPCLFVFDNFETTSNPVEMYNWIDSFIRLPNKALVTTRLREFKGDYPIEVRGMSDPEARALITQTASALGVSGLLTEDYTAELISHSEGHPYVIKILLGEVSKERKLTSIPHLVAGTDDILTALFERTYAALSPCSQRAFLTLAAWNSAVPRIALEAVLVRSTKERSEVERGVESLLQYSMAEVHQAPKDGQEFIALPLVASVFGKKKLNISPSRASIQADVELLQMLGPSKRDDVTLGLAKKMERFIGNIARKVENGASYADYAPIIEMICRAYNPAWLIVARWHMEQRTPDGYVAARAELERFLENDPPADQAAEAWHLLGHTCFQLGDALGEVHAYVERAQLSDVPFYDLSNTAHSLINYVRDRAEEIEREHKRELATRLLEVMNLRRDEAGPVDLSRMAWLAIHCGNESVAREYVQFGMAMDPDNHHLYKLGQRLGINTREA
ncbi:MAG: hypothetical protein K0Q43_2645 [Ramlibacter sp.]|jgi:hypothetical protein|nr:hypothetical protein [Ramlibacter sp.]